jgi:signal transduction histidine kinase
MGSPNRWTVEARYYLTAGVLIGAAVLRAILSYQDQPSLVSVLLLLMLWLVCFVGEHFVTRRWPLTFPLYVILQTALIVALLSKPLNPDYFAVLFSVLSMQITQRFRPKIAALWIAIFSIAMFVPLMRVYPLGSTIAFTLVYTAVCILTAAYSLAARRAVQARSKNQSLADELQKTNRELESYAARLERLAISEERNRLARELHDSVTQTVFSMTLSTQSAMMLLDRSPDEVMDQLSRLYQLARSATGEIQTLISELKPELVVEEKLSEAIQRHLVDGHLPESLHVDLRVEGEEMLDEGEAMGLFRIVQEALNNITKHAETDQAWIRMHMLEPIWIEIEDHGRGFGLENPKDKQGVGLYSMAERAHEIGWRLQIKTVPGEGTLVRVERNPPGERST